MKANANPIELVLNDVLLPRGFRKKKKTWQLPMDDTILLVDLQRSSWGPQFYINLAVFVRKLSDNPAPKEKDCHIRNRLDSSTGASPTVAEALDLENTALDDNQRRAVLQQAMEAEGLKFLHDFESIPKIRESLLKGEYKGLSVDLEARTL
jgi:hypothetical protein